MATDEQTDPGNQADPGKPKGKPLRWFAALTGAVAALAVLTANLDKVLSFGAKWIAPYVAPYLEATSVVKVTIDDDVPGTADVFVANPTNDTQAIAVDHADRSKPAELKVPADIVYTIGWQGAAIEAGSASRILLAKGGAAFRLARNGMGEGQIKVSLRQQEGNGPAPAVTQPNANLLISARSIQAVNSGSVTLGAGALPELDRAVAIIGLFETGTTDCAHRVSFVPAFGGDANAVTPAVGCLGMSIPGWLTEVLSTLDGGDSHRLDALLGDHAVAIRNYIADRKAIPEEGTLRAATDKLTASPEFWIFYQSRVLAAYAQATEVARGVGLLSERGRLLVFDRLIQMGPAMVERATSSYSQKFPGGGSGQPKPESERLTDLGEIFKAMGPRFVSQFIARRVDTIVTGQGMIRGIAFDLNQLGVSDKG